MKAKSLIVTIISAAILAFGAYSGFFSAGVQAWLGIVSMAGVLVLSTFFPSGTLVAGWNWVMWTTNIAAIVVQLFTAIGSQSLLSPEIVNAIIIGINIFVQTFLKDYGTGSVAVNKIV